MGEYAVLLQTASEQLVGALFVVTGITGVFLGILLQFGAVVFSLGPTPRKAVAVLMSTVTAAGVTIELGLGGQTVLATSVITLLGALSGGTLARFHTAVNPPEENDIPPLLVDYQNKVKDRLEELYQAVKARR